MYTIRQAAARSGVSVPLLRAWERRYHIVQPARTAAGYRLYDDAALDRLRAMRRLVSAGWTPSTAATAILAGDPAALAESRPFDPAIGPAASGPVGAPRVQDDLVAAFVSAAVDLDAGGLERILDRMFASGSFEPMAETVLMPAMAAVGDAWADGRLGVAGEHAASHAVLRRLGAAYQAAGSGSPTDRAILVGMPPTVRHELGALTFSTAARRAGLAVLYLGPDLPADEWVAAAVRTRARAAVIGVLSSTDVRPGVAVALALAAAEQDLTVVFGGRSADRAAELATAVTDAARAGEAGAPARRIVVLPDSLGEAVASLQAHLATA